MIISLRKTWTICKSLENGRKFICTGVCMPTSPAGHALWTRHSHSRGKETASAPRCFQRVAGSCPGASEQPQSCPSSAGPQGPPSGQSPRVGCKLLGPPGSSLTPALSQQCPCAPWLALPGALSPAPASCPVPLVTLQGRQGSRGCIPGSPGESGRVSRGSQGLRSPLESRRGSLGAP